MTNSIRSSLFAGLASLAAPLSLAAHEGHAGSHGWLAGAAQPLLSVDHFLAGVSVALVVAIGVGTVGRARRRSHTESVAEP